MLILTLKKNIGLSRPRTWNGPKTWGGVCVFFCSLFLSLSPPLSVFLTAAAAAAVPQVMLGN